MRFSASRKDLILACKVVTEAVPGKIIRPVLANCRMSVVDDQLTLEATDLEVGVSRHVAVSPDAAPGVTLVPASSLCQALHVSPDDSLTFSLVGTSLHIEGPRTDFDLPVAPPSDWPDWVTPFPPAHHVVHTPRLCQAIGLVEFAVAKKALPGVACGGILFDFADDSVTLVATDTRSMSVAGMPAEKNGDHSPVALCSTASAKFAGLLRKCLQTTTSESVRLHFDTKSSTAIGDDFRLSGRLVEGRFPNYHNLMAMKMEQTATVQSSELLEALKQVSVTQDPVDPSATLEFTNSFLRLHTSGRGRASATIVIDYQGPRVTIDVYPKLLIDILNVTKNKPLTAEFHTGDDPLFLHAPESSDEPVHRCMIAPRCEASSKPVAQEAASL